MKHFLTVYLISQILCMSTLVQASNTLSAKAVVHQFVQADTEGKRLTATGWNRTDQAFETRSKPPGRIKMIIIAPNYGLTQASFTAETAEFEMGYEELGQIDGNLKFRPSNPGVEVRSIYKFVLKHGDSKASKTGAVEPNWKIVGQQPIEMRITAAAARLYLIGLIKSAKDAEIKTNAQRSLEQLHKFP